MSEPPFCLGTFQSTPSAWRETLYSLLDINKENSFQSTPSAWRETYIRMDIVTHQIFQSTPSAWRETQPIPIKPTKVTISIHSLRMEGDKSGKIFFVQCCISIHSLRMEGDKCVPISSTRSAVFQSTPSAWRETYLPPRRSQHGNYFNPLPPHGGRLCFSCFSSLKTTFQSTPSAWRETLYHHNNGRCDTPFQSTPSAWRETVIIWQCQPLRKNFNPLPPHGGRLYHHNNGRCDTPFQSTPSAWRETVQKECTPPPICISIHSLRMEGDLRITMTHIPTRRFQSTPSAWRETPDTRL